MVKGQSKIGETKPKDKPKLIHVKKGGKTKRYLVYDGKRYKIDSPYDDKFVISKLTKIIEKLVDYNARKKRRKVYRKKNAPTSGSQSKIGETKTESPTEKVSVNEYGNMNKVPPQQIINAVRDLNPKYEDTRAVEYRKDLIKMLDDQVKVKETVFNAITADLARSTKLLDDKDKDIKKREHDLKLLESQVKTEKNRLAITDKDYKQKIKVIEAAEGKLKDRKEDLKTSRLEYDALVKENEKLKDIQKEAKERNQEIDDLLNNKNISLKKKTEEIEKLNDKLRTYAATFLELEKDIKQKEEEKVKLLEETEQAKAMKYFEMHRAKMREFYSNPNNIKAKELRELAKNEFGIKVDKEPDDKGRINPKTMREITNEIVDDDKKMWNLGIRHYAAKYPWLKKEDIDLTKTPIKTPRTTPKGSAKKDSKPKNDIKPEDLTKALDNIKKDKEKEAEIEAYNNAHKYLSDKLKFGDLEAYFKSHGVNDIKVKRGVKDHNKNSYITEFLEREGMIEAVIEEKSGKKGKESSERERTEGTKEVIEELENKTDDLKKEIEEAKEAQDQLKIAEGIADDQSKIAEEEKVDVVEAAQDLNETIEEFNLEEFHEKQKGTGSIDSGLTNFEIEKFMKDYYKDGFIGVYAIDQLKKIKKVGDNFSFIMNTQPINVPIGHWIAVKVDKDTIEYYDSFAGDPPDELIKWLKKKLASNVYQLKINRTKFQKTNTSNCGYFAMDFLAKRYGGETFKEATGFKIFEDSINGEKEIKQLKKSIQEFGSLKIK